MSRRRRGGLLRRLDPRPPARRLRAAWRVGRLRSALPALALDVVDRVDGDLAAVPSLDVLDDEQLLAVLRNGQRMLVSLHGHEILTGLLLPATATTSVTGASMALDAVRRAQREGVGPAQLVTRDPVVLALVPPRVGAGDDAIAALLAAAPAAPALPAVHTERPDQAAITREALRLRIRWVEELMARAAEAIGRRLAADGRLHSHDDIRHLRLTEVDAAVRHRVPVVPTIGRGRQAISATRKLPARFRLDDGGRPWAAPPIGRRTRHDADAAGGAVGAGGGTATGPVHVHEVGTDVPSDVVLVVRHLDPRLAAVVPRLAGLVAETGSPLSHLAILAREHGVPIVVGLDDATARFADGEIVTVDGHAGTVTASGAAPVPVEVAA